jgi:hypothetical protein
MFQWFLRKIINLMGRVYVILDSFLENEGGPILGIEIDDDFEIMNRRQLCQYVEHKFGWKEGEFWNLHSTSKIRVCCQIARNNKFKGKKK